MLVCTPVAVEFGISMSKTTLEIFLQPDCCSFGIFDLDFLMCMMIYTVLPKHVVLDAAAFAARRMHGICVNPWYG